jgi:hypothetical protein
MIGSGQPAVAARLNSGVRAHMKILAGVSSSLIALVACTSNPRSSELPFFPQVAPTPLGLDEVWLTAAFNGEVVVEKGCVRVRHPEGKNSTTVLWYQGIELSQDASGMSLRDARSGRVLTRFNALTDFGGGTAPAEYIEQRYPEVARRCGPPYAYGYPANIYDAP